VRIFLWTDHVPVCTLLLSHPYIFPCSVIIVAPVETVKTKCIELNKSFVDGLKHIVTTEGLPGIYQGVAATALKQGTNQGFRFMWFNEYKRIATNGGEVPLSPIGSLLGGMSAGCFSVRTNWPS